MATYNTLKYGSSGNDVKKLQQSLISAGYDLGKSGADGIYGSKTQKAVTDYQTKNGLKVDGIAGEQTLGKLYTPAETNTQTSTGTTTTQPKAPQTTQDWLQHYETGIQGYKPPEAAQVEDYASPYAADIEAALDSWKNRKDFTYDFNTDPMYQQYRDQYMLGGQQAMRDTMGQAAALTGGYGNSYAQMVGQQTYDNYLSQLNNIIPELRSQAYDQYLAEGDRLAEALSTYLSLDDMAYDRYRDYVDDALAKQSEEYQRYMDELSYMQGERDYYYDKNADEQAYELALLEAASKGGGSGGGSDPNERKEGSMAYDDARKKVVGIAKASGKQQAYATIEALYQAGKISDYEKNALQDYLAGTSFTYGSLGRGGGTVNVNKNVQEVR